MKKNVFGRKLKRDKNERTALFKSLISSLVLNEKIKTTESKAKAIKPEIDKLVTKAKQGGNSARNVLQKSLSRPALEKMIKEIGPRFTKRQGGYTRLIKLGKRFGDDAPTAILEWSDVAAIIPVADKVKEPKQKTVKAKKPEKIKAKKVVAKKPVKKVSKTK
jgi:large subunit ribosomal protein L17